MIAVAVEFSGSVMVGICDLKLDGCVAVTSAEPIYAVWERPGGRKIAVCGSCLSRQFKSGEWRRAEPRKPRLDVESLRHAVQFAAEPANQGTRAEMVAFLRKEISDDQQHSPSVIEVLRGFLRQLEQVDRND